MAVNYIIQIFQSINIVPCQASVQSSTYTYNICDWIYKTDHNVTRTEIRIMP